MERRKKEELKEDEMKIGLKTESRNDDRKTKKEEEKRED
jgi:hypothetical protein